VGQLSRPPFPVEHPDFAPIADGIDLFFIEAVDTEESGDFLAAVWNENTRIDLAPGPARNSASEHLSAHADCVEVIADAPH